MWAAVGTILMIAAASLPLRAVRLLSTAMISLALCLMVLVLYKGEAVYGAKRWINIGPVSFQPSEMLKVALVVYLASAFSRVYVGPDKIKRTKWVFPLIVGSIAVTLTLLQKDVGTAALLVMTMFATSFAAGARVSKLVIAAFGLLAVFWLLLFTPITQSGPLKPIGDRLSHTKSRLVAYRDPWGTQQNEGYQIAQSLIGLGTGGWFGKGLCNGKVKLMISQSYNDFAVVTLAEESGFVAMIILLGAFVVLTYRGLEIASMSKSRFGTIMAAGLTSYITCQVLVNMAVITASIPVTGVPMPFISYGGTALMFTMAAVGLYWLSPEEMARDWKSW